MSERDAEFSEPTKKIIAERSGYRCAYLGCDESTVGPGAGVNDVERKSIAAHVFGAGTGPGSPRGTGGLSAEQRSQPANGIWCCEDHGRLVDGDKGKDYPASMLLAWKALHEDRIAREVRKVPYLQRGWLESITIDENPLFEPGTSIELGKVTLFVGQNGAGKSAVCEWLSGSAGNVQDLCRWNDDKLLHMRSSILVPDRIEVDMRFQNGSLMVQYGGRNALDTSHVLRIVNISDRIDRDGEPHEDDREFLARVWGIHPYQVPTILRGLSTSKYGYVRMAELRDVDEDEAREVSEDDLPRATRLLRDRRPPLRLFAMIGDHDSPLPLTSLSGRERSQIIVSGAMVVADYYSNYQTTVLILELGSQFLPGLLLASYATRLQSPDFGFQTILVSAPERPEVDWTGWSIANFSRHDGKSFVEKNKIAR